MGRKRLGLIVNPVAGLGGRVGLKGSDGVEIQKRALALGAMPRSLERTIQALRRIEPLEGLEIVTCPGVMGADAARACGFRPTIIGPTIVGPTIAGPTIVGGTGVGRTGARAIEPGETTPEDTRSAAREMRRLNVDLLLFAGGDGTARDIYSAVGTALPVLGIPAGVKIHSAVYATHPASAGELASLVLQDKVTALRETEVMDIDEDACRQGIVSARLCGTLKVPFQRRFLQGLKIPSPPSEQVGMQAIAADVLSGMEEGWLYVIGPGSTTRAIADRLGVEKTLIGVDVIVGERKGERVGRLVAADVNESRLLELLEGRRARIVVTPIGGQGYLFGRGNQQISPQVICHVGRKNIVIVSTIGKIHALGGRPLRVDTGDEKVDEMLRGYVQVITGYNEKIVYKVS